MSRTRIVLASLALMGLAVVGCKSQHEEGVTSNLVQQWVTVNVNTATATDAAKAVLTDEGLKEVTASSTNVDGTASGMKSDGTKVTVSVKKVTDTTSTVTAQVGTIGDRKLGAEIAKKVKIKAEGMTTKTM